MRRWLLGRGTLALVLIEIVGQDHGTNGVDEVRPLWDALREHHADVSLYRALNTDIVQAWDLRRAWYLRVLRDGGVIVKARADSDLVGYAVASCEEGPDDTFDVGSGVAEIISLMVARDARGEGVGSSMISAVEAWALSRGLGSLRVAVMSGNDRAVRFYEEHEFEEAEQVFYRRLR